LDLLLGQCSLEDCQVVDDAVRSVLVASCSDEELGEVGREWAHTFGLLGEQLTVDVDLLGLFVFDERIVVPSGPVKPIGGGLIKALRGGRTAAVAVEIDASVGPRNVGLNAATLTLSNEPKRRAVHIGNVLLPQHDGHCIIGSGQVHRIFITRGFQKHVSAGAFTGHVETTTATGATAAGFGDLGGIIDGANVLAVGRFDGDAVGFDAFEVPVGEDWRHGLGLRCNRAQGEGCQTGKEPERGIFGFLIHNW